MTKNIDILGIGNAIMDVIAPVSEDTLKAQSVEKGGMTLIDEARALTLHKAFAAAGGDVQEIAGGSAANTIVGLAELGIATAYVGKVAKDALGARFAKGLRASGVAYDTAPLAGGQATARCLIAVTPDGERSMSTFLGASTAFGRADIAKTLVANAKVIYLEGYLFDSDDAKAAFVKASEMAKASGAKVALTLSDSFCVDRHRESFRHLVDNHVDILFANEAEILSLYETDSLDVCVQALRKVSTVAAVTRSEKGSVIIDHGTVHTIPSVPVDKVVDTTGAGDQYAAGVLAGYCMGLGWADAGYLGSQCAAEVISHYGARPHRSIHAQVIGA